MAIATVMLSNEFNNHTCQICWGGISLAGQSPKARSLGGRGSDDDDDCDDYMTSGVLDGKIQLLLENCIFWIFFGFFLSALSTN